MNIQNAFHLFVGLMIIGCGGFPASDILAQDAETSSTLTLFTETFDGYVKHLAAVQFEEPDEIINLNTRFELAYRKWLNEHVGVNLMTWFVYDGAFDVEDNFAKKDEDDYRAYATLREAVLDVSFGKLDAHFGKQQVVWGKTDGFRVTDVVNPLNMRDTAVTEFLDQRIPLWMANIEYYFTSDFSAQALIIPDLEFNEFTFPEFSEGVSVGSTHAPSETFTNTEYGVRFSGFYQGWDLALNYLYSWDDTPTFKRFNENETVIVVPEHERLHIVGGSVANVLWNTVVRGEFAAHIGKYFTVDDSAVPEMAVEKTLLSYALACERDLLNIHWIAQTLQETIIDYDAAISTDEFSTYLTLNGSKDFWNETLELEMFVLYNAQKERFIMQPSAAYDVNDSLALSVGVDVVVGKDRAAVAEHDQRFYAEVRYNF